MRTVIEIRFWATAALTTLAVILLLSYPRSTKGKGLLAAFLLLSLVPVIGFYTQTALMRSGALAKSSDILSSIFYLAGVAATGCLLAYIGVIRPSGEQARSDSEHTFSLSKSAPNHTMTTEQQTQPQVARSPVEVFGFKPAWKTKLWMGAGYPAIALIAGIFIASSEDLGFSDNAPLIFLGFGAWFVFALYHASTRSKFSVELSPDAIRVGEVSKPWSEITKAERKAGITLGMTPHITLFTKDGSIVIPAAMDSTEYIWSVVERHVKDAATK